MLKNRMLPLLKPLAVALAVVVGGAATAVAQTPAKVTNIRYVYCAETLPVSGSMFWIGEKLGYFAQERVSLEVIPVSGGTGACMQLLAAGRADISAPSPDVVLSATADGKELGLKYFYNIAPTFLFDASVMPGSKVKSFADLKGATIGLASLGGSFELFAKAGLRAAGIDPAGVTFVAVGTEAGAAETLKRGSIQALVINDVRYAALEAAGYTFEYLPKPGVTAELFGAGMLGRQAWLTENQDAAVGYVRAYSKAMVFIRANPEAAIKLHWEMYPQFAPQGDRTAAMKNELAVLNRRVSGIKDDGSAERPWGRFTEASWKAYVTFLGLGDKIKDVSPFYTNDVSGKIGPIDVAAIQAQAKSWPK